MTGTQVQACMTKVRNAQGPVVLKLAFQAATELGLDHLKWTNSLHGEAATMQQVM